MCGEHPQAVAAGGQPRGIIPACAGNTLTAIRVTRLTGDHPRVCGEHPSTRTVRAFTIGSSPRVRGTLEVVHLAGEYPGIIPACAGNTLIGRGALPRSGDHPRVCGEHPGGHEVEWDRSGSSPRVRGTPRQHDRARERRGIIPACAGNTE